MSEHSEHSGTPSRNIKKRAWVFTWNNYTSQDIEYLVSTLKNHEYIFGEEIGGNTGTPHLQGVLRFKNPRQWKGVCEMLKNNFTEPCTNWNASLNYCSKDGRTYTNIQKKMTRKERQLEKYNEVIWREWQKEIIDIIHEEPDSRTIHWYYEREGNKGKSFLAKYLVLKYDAIISDGKKDNVFNQVKLWLDTHEQTEDPKLIILDCPRYNKEHINYGVLEQLKNGMIYSGKYEGGICIFNNPHVIIFSNEEPDYEKMSRDRWNVKEIH